MAFKKLKYWFDSELAEMLSDKIVTLKPNFPKEAFIKSVTDKIGNLELKDRVELIADELHTNLEGTITENINTLVGILGPENDQETGMFTNFYWVMPIAKYVEKYGIEYFESSMNAIAEITKRNTGEYTIRPFLVRYPKKTLAILKDWSLNENRHIRRLCSEGIRPRLPWAKKLDQFIENPKPILPILENFKDDTSKYVQKSVANCLNDILKDNLEIGKEVVEKWNVNPTKERKWIIRHALRNLLKAQDTWALTIIKS